MNRHHKNLTHLFHAGQCMHASSQSPHAGICIMLTHGTCYNSYEHNRASQASQSLYPALSVKRRVITAFTKTLTLVPNLSHINPLATSTPIFRSFNIIPKYLRPYPSSFRTNILNSFLILNAFYDKN